MIPCYNEALTIHKVVTHFKTALPGASIVVYDNNSTDDTRGQAERAGARVFHEPMQGKGNVVRRMFRDITADFYILVDGDDTYDASIAPMMLRLALQERMDLVNCVRLGTSVGAYRLGHQFGNRMLTSMVKYIFGNRVEDMLSGYKILSRRFVKSFPALSNGFDIETELSVHSTGAVPPDRARHRYLQGAAKRFDEQVEYLSGWISDSLADRGADQA